MSADTPNQSSKGSASYGAKDIQVLEGLDPVRKRPGMYIGSTGLAGLHHLIWEVVDNAVDEAMAGFATRIGVTLLADGGCKVDDNGRGFPVDPYPSGPHKGKSASVVSHSARKFCVLPGGPAEPQNHSRPFVYVIDAMTSGRAHRSTTRRELKSQRGGECDRISRGRGLVRYSAPHGVGLFDD